MGVLASPAFELARIVFGELVVFVRQEPSPGHRVQFVVVYKYCHVVVYMKGRVKVNAPSIPKGMSRKTVDREGGRSGAVACSTTLILLQYITLQRAQRYR